MGALFRKRGRVLHHCDYRTPISAYTSTLGSDSVMPRLDRLISTTFSTR